MNKLTIMAALATALLACVMSTEAQDVAVEREPAAVEQENASAQQDIGTKGPEGFSSLVGPFAAAVIIIGAAYSIGKIGSCAVESMARQPEVAGSIQTTMLIAAALIEGITFFGLIVCLLAIYA